MAPDLVIKNARIATMNPMETAPWGAIDDVDIAVTSGKISFLAKAAGITAAQVFDARGKWLTPGLIDCHTHLVYGGNRAAEWGMRIAGVSYEEIARAGGGILSTVQATRAANADALFKSAHKRLKRLLAEGVTTVEIKSGYGLDLPNETKMLQVARKLAEECGICVRTTFLGAHALPPEYVDHADDYITSITDVMMPALANASLVDAVDVFCENIGFSRKQCQTVFDRAQALGLPVKGHVEQLSDQKGALLVAEYGGLSVDHLEYLSPEDVPTLAASQVTPVLLPGAYYFLNETKLPPIAAMRESCMGMAVATDLNPGSSPVNSLLTCMNLACVMFGLTAEEALAGATTHAAAALGLADSKGRIAEGFDADLVLWDIEDPAEIAYGINMIVPEKILVAGHDTSTIRTR